MLNCRLLIVLIFTLFFIKCSKSGKDYPSVLSGSSWRATDYWQGIGSADDGWHHIVGDASTLTFNDHGKGLESVNGIQNKGYYYQVTSDSTMDVKGDSVTQTGHELFFIRNDTLEIWGIGCTEGCGTRYLRNLND